MCSVKPFGCVHGVLVGARGGQNHNMTRPTAALEAMHSAETERRTQNGNYSHNGNHGQLLVT
jgi:hypothetical protein